MFFVEGTTINISSGDTGAIRLTANAKYKGTETPYVFGERDRAVFTIKANNGEIIKQRAYPIVGNAFTVVFFNADTQAFTQSSYQWDVRYVINPYYEQGNPIPVDGDQVITPKLPMGVNILNVVGVI